MELNQILTSPSYSEYCRYVSNNSSMWEDLYQEFRTKLFIKFKSIQANTNIDGYCKSMIYNLWRDMNGFRPGRKGGMALANYADRSVEITDRIMTGAEEVQVADIELSLDALLRSSNPRTKKKAEIFAAAVLTTRAEVSRTTGINYALVHEAVNTTKQTIKTNMTKNEIKSALLAQGISSSYSGKDKTFYTNKKPSVEVEAMIIKAGFKQCKK